MHGQQNKKKLESSFVFTARMIRNRKIQSVKDTGDTVNVKGGDGPNYPNCVRTQGSRPDQTIPDQKSPQQTRADQFPAIHQYKWQADKTNLDCVVCNRTLHSSFPANQEKS
jgi:hypothetical protein